MRVLDLFPRSIFQGDLESVLLKRLNMFAEGILSNPHNSPDASYKLAGQLNQQRELVLQHPLIQELCNQSILPACETWIRHVLDREPPQGRGPWHPGCYQLQMIDIWLNSQKSGDYNPTHTHGGSFSGVLYLKVPDQINSQSFDGQLCFHGPEEWNIQSFRTGMAHYVLPVAGQFYVFPAWQPHSVAPFRGEGERWSIAFNVMAIPKAAKRPETMTVKNVSLSTSRAASKGF